MPRFDVEPLTEFAAAMLRASGAADDDARFVAESLVDSDVVGHESHGVARLPAYLRQIERGELVPGGKLEVVYETPAIVVCDGHLGLGHPHMRRVVEMVDAKARAVGIGCATVRRSGHTGRLGQWTEAAARRGLAALMTVNDNGVYVVVAPPGGTEPRLSTNPLSIAVPSGGEPIVLDMATSVVASGKLLVRRLAGEPCPPGWLVDAAGQPTTDPRTIAHDPPGSILPLGGPAAMHKGFALALLLDLLVGGLSGGHCPPPREGEVECNTVLFVAWDPAHFAGRGHFDGEVRTLVDWVRSCRMQPGKSAPRMPGERTTAARQFAQTSGVEVRAGAWSRLLRAAEKLGVAAP